MPANIAQILKQLIAVKNAYPANENASAGRYGYVLDDARRNLFELVEAILEADDEVLLAIKETIGHWARGDFLQLSGSITHASTIPTHQGEIGRILIRRSATEDYLPARGRRPAQEIERYRANTGAYPNNAYGATRHTTLGSPLAGFYDVSEEQLLFYAGEDAKIELINTSRQARTVTDAGITSGADILSFASANSSDIGAIAVVEGAGVDGVDFASEIRSVAAPNATLADAAGTTVSNAYALIARCQSPADYQSAVLVKAASKVVKEGDSPSLATYFTQQSDKMEMLIRQNKQILPDVVMEEKAA